MWQREEGLARGSPSLVLDPHYLLREGSFTEVGNVAPRNEPLRTAKAVCCCQSLRETYLDKPVQRPDPEPFIDGDYGSETPPDGTLGIDSNSE